MTVDESRLIHARNDAKHWKQLFGAIGVFLEKNGIVLTVEKSEEGYEIVRYGELFEGGLGI